MRIATAKLAFAAAAFFAFQSCTPDEAPPELTVTTDPAPAAPTHAPATAPQLVQTLDAVTGGEQSRLGAAVKDVRAMLLAEAAAARGDDTEATARWFEALATAQDRFGKRALEGWLKSYTRQLGKKSDPVVLARLVLAETRGGLVSPYMVAKQLNNEPEVVKLLIQTTPEWLLPLETAPAVPIAGLEPPTGKGLPADDPLLVKATQKSCAAVKMSIDAWKTWLSQFNDDVRTYFNALVHQCSGQASEAIAAFKSVHPKLARTKATHALAVEAAARAAVLERANGRRSDAADTYLDLVKHWSLEGVTPQSMGLDDSAMALRRIDETLWASRYRAQVADYENAKIYAQQALTHIANAYAARAALSQNIKEQLATLRAEAYHALAYRIAVEQRQWDGALSLNLLALQTPHLNREWTERLQWFSGLYEYLAGNLDSAKRKWEQLLGQTKDDSMRAMTYFWLAKAHAKLGQSAESAFYLSTIVDDYPLSYYSIVAPAAAGLKGGKDWRRVFGDPRELEQRLRAGRDFDLDKLRRDPALSRLLTRAEVLVAAQGLNDWARTAVDELDTAANAALRPEVDTSAFVYLSRLHYNVGSYLKVIGLTTKLAKASPGFWQEWPEQVLVHFPRPWRDVYKRNALDHALDESLLLAISRQESGFTPDIRSSADAIGIMQLIRPTAMRFASELGMDSGNLEELLRSPPANIRLGSRYLKVLSTTYKGFQPAVYGGYNAGEPAVDSWLQRRGHSDPLMFIELVPYGETKDYIKNVWRNVLVYQFLDRADGGRPEPVVGQPEPMGPESRW